MGQCQNCSKGLRDGSFSFGTRIISTVFTTKSHVRTTWEQLQRQDFLLYQLGSVQVRQKAQHLLFSDEKRVKLQASVSREHIQGLSNLLDSFWLNHLLFKIPFGKYLYSFRVNVVRPTSFDCHFFPLQNNPIEQRKRSPSAGENLQVPTPATDLTSVAGGKKGVFKCIFFSYLGFKTAV